MIGWNADDPARAPYRDSRDADLRGTHGLFLVESSRCVARFLRACCAGTFEAVSVLAAPQHVPLLGPLASAAGCPLLEGSMEEIAAWSGYRFHHGALALGRHTGGLPLPALLAAQPSVAALVVADGVVHVDNMGSLFRNAACLGATGVLLGPGCADPLGRKAVRISMGRVFGVPWSSCPSLSDALRDLREAGFRPTAVEQSPGALPLHAWRPAVREALLMGAEGRGLAPDLLAACDACVEIPSTPDPLAGEGDGPPSLNVATALAVVLGELRRHR
jgi:tRNA G18 (ribose-2'-O)-methylase SpoU